MNLAVTDEFSLTEIQPTDKPAYLGHLNDRDIYERTLRIPYPYTEADAGRWLGFVAQAAERHGEPVHFAIRDGESLIGGIGFDGLTKGHRAEVGYWLAKPWWGRGIMTAVVGKAVEHAISEWKLVRITAHVFTTNPASARVLEKNGFQFEGLLRKHHLKDGRFLDSRLYALVK